MRLSKRRPLHLTALVALLALAAVACGNGDDGAGGTDGGGENLTGKVVVSGSSTVEPITSLVSELFNNDGGQPGVEVVVDGPGTGDGFQLFCNGETDISDASRAISEEEVQACADKGIEFVELKVGIDGLSVLTNTANDAVDCVTFADIYGLVGPESDGVATWQAGEDIAKQVGKASDLPDAPLSVYGPGEESGTYDSFVEIVIEDAADERGKEAETRKDYTPSAEDNVIISGVQGSDSSFGWVGYAFAANAQDVKLLAVDDGESGCVDPTAETIASGDYPISRPLFIYVNAKKVADSEALAAFVDYYLSEEGIAAVSEAGYVSLADDALAETRQVWENKTTGTRES